MPRRAPERRPRTARAPLRDAAVVLEGRVSIEAALVAGVRPVDEILAVDPGDRRFSHLRELARDHDVALRRVAAEELRRYATGTTHGGVIALAGERAYLTVDDLLREAAAPAFVVMLDGLEDPYNFGQAIRSLYAAGADGLIVRERSWEPAAAIVARASAGASELLPTAAVATVEDAATACRQYGLLVTCASTRSDAEWLHETDLTQPALVVIGGERRGITRSFIESADRIVRIPYGRRGAHALGAATTAALIAFEALRQRRAAGIVPGLASGVLG